MTSTEKDLRCLDHLVGGGGFFDKTLACVVGLEEASSSHIPKGLNSFLCLFCLIVKLTFQAGKTTFGPEFQKCLNFFRQKL